MTGWLPRRSPPFLEQDGVSRVLTLRPPASSDPLRLQSLLAETRGRLRSSLPASVAVQTRIEPGVGPVRVDPEALSGVLVALFRGAEREGGVLTLALDQVPLWAPEASALGLVSGTYVRLELSDTGFGVDEADLPRLLEPLLASPASGPSGESQSVVQVESRPGQGIRLSFFWPLCLEPSPRAPAGADPVPSAQPASGRGERILFVDDESALARMGTRILGRLGYRVVDSVDPEAALALFRQDPEDWALVITDQSMPGMTGARLVSEIHRLRPDLPAVLCAGSSRGLDHGDPELQGFDEFLFKPVSAQILGEVVARILERRRQGPEASGNPAPQPRASEVVGPGEALRELDVAEGLSRVMGDEELYADLLARFVTSHGEAGRRIRAAWQAGDLTAAADLSHGLKGVSSTLGAAEVSSRAARLEEFFWAGGEPADVEPELQGLHEALVRVLQAIRGHLPESPRPTGQVDRTRFDAVCRELRRLLAESDPEANSLFSRESLLLEAVLAESFVPLRRSIRNYDYDEALALLPQSGRPAGILVSEEADP